MRLPVRAGWALFARLYRVYFSTLRFVTVLPNGHVGTLDDYPFDADLFALSERDSVTLAGITTGRGFEVLVTRGRDGDRVSTILGALGCSIVRGSTRGGGVEGLISLIGDHAEPRRPIALVVDGPLGPAGVAKAGVVVVAARTGRPIRAVAAAARRRLTLKGTWAQIHVPLPFTRVVLAVESVPYDATGRIEDMAARADDVTRALTRARRRAHDVVGRADEAATDAARVQS